VTRISGWGRLPRCSAALEAGGVSSLGNTAPGIATGRGQRTLAYWDLSVFEVVLVPSLCWVVDVVLAFPLGSVADVVVVFFDGSL